MPKEALFFLILGIGVFVVLSNTRVITSPDIALLRRNGKILEGVRLTPGLRIVWSFWGLIEVDEDIPVRGGAYDIDIPIENVVSRNQEITFNARILVYVIKARDGLPAYGAAYNFITWLAGTTGKNIEERVANLLSSIVSGAAETVIKSFPPEEITSSAEINRMISQQVSDEVTAVIQHWGTVFKVIIEELQNPLMVSIESQKQQLLVDKQKAMTKGDSDAYRVKVMRKTNGDRAAAQLEKGIAWETAKNVTVFDGAENLLGRLLPPPRQRRRDRPNRQAVQTDDHPRQTRSSRAKQVIQVVNEATQDKRQRRRRRR